MSENLFIVQRKFLRLSGHEDIKNDKELACGVGKTKKWLYKCHTMKYIGNILAMFMAPFPLIDYIIYNIDDLTLATASLSILFTTFLTIIKAATFLAYKSEFKRLMLEFEMICVELHGVETKRLLVTANAAAKRFVKLYAYGVCFTAFYFAVGPMLNFVWASIQDRSWEPDQPLPMRFRFDYESFPGYQITYIYILATIWSLVQYAISVDGLFVAFTINLRGYFQALQYFIRTNTFDKSEALLQQDLRTYVQFHVLLLSLIHRVHCIYKPIIFGQFLMTSLQMCVIIYQLVTNMGVLMEMIVYFAFLYTILLQLLVYCYGAEMLKLESFAVGTAIQLSQWYNLPPRHRCVLGLMMQRSQREIIIKAGFYEASLATFLNIVKAAMSYITIIQSME